MVPIRVSQILPCLQREASCHAINQLKTWAFMTGP